MKSLIRPAIVLFALFTILTGVIYPLVVTGIAKVAFADEAGGSIITVDGKAVGSSLIAQGFTDPKYFWSRPSAAGVNGYDATSGSGSNLGPTNPALTDAVKSRIDALQKVDPGNTTRLPIDLVTASASGLDPHLSRAAADYQVARVARARHLSADAVRQVVDRMTDASVPGFIGQPIVNVLELNLALDHPDRVPSASAADDAMGFRYRGFLPSSH